MKKSTAVLTAVACSMIAVGSVCAVVGRMMGGETGLYYKSGEGIQIASQKKPEYLTDEQKLDAFSQIVLEDADYFQIHLIPSDHFGYKAQYYDDDSLQLSVENGKLTVTGTTGNGDSSEKYMIINLSPNAYDHTENRVLEIYYPEGTEFDSVSVQADYGVLEADSLHADSLKADGEGAACNLMNFTGQTAEFTGDYSSFYLEAGTLEKELTVDSSYSSLDIQEVTAGDVSITGDSMDSRLTELTTGNLKLSGDYIGSTMETVQADSLSFDGDYGSVSVHDSAFQSAELVCDDQTISGTNTALGDVIFSGDYCTVQLYRAALNSLDASGDYGEYEISGTLQGKAAWDADNADIQLELEDASSFGLDITAEYGDIRLPDGESVSQSDDVQAAEGSEELADSEYTETDDSITRVKQSGNGQQTIGLKGSYTNLRLENAI